MLGTLGSRTPLAWGLTRSADPARLAPLAVAPMRVVAAHVARGLAAA